MKAKIHILACRNVLVPMEEERPPAVKSTPALMNHSANTRGTVTGLRKAPGGPQPCVVGQASGDECSFMANSLC